MNTLSYTVRLTDPVNHLSSFRSGINVDEHKADRQRRRS